MPKVKVVATRSSGSPWLYVFVVCSLVFAAVCANFSWVQEKHDADSLLLSLISVDRWTPFYWGDNRYGMLVPLLARFVADYRENLLFQTQILVLAPFAVAVLLNVYYLGERQGWSLRNLSIAVLAVVMAMALLRPTERVVQTHLLAHPYHLSFALGLLSVAFVLRVQGQMVRRYAAAAVAMTLSLWVNPSNVVFFAGLFVLLPDRVREWRATLRERGAGLVGMGLAFAAIRWYASSFPDLGGAKLAEPGQILESIAKLWVNTFAYILNPAVAIAAAVVAIVTWVVLWRRESLRRLVVWSDAWVFTVIAIVFALSIASTDWVIRNEYEPRYWTVSVSVLLLVGVSWLGATLFDWIERARQSSRDAAMISVAALAGMALIVFGVPSAGKAKEAIDKHTSVRWRLAEDFRCTHMLGNYEAAWSTVFHAKAHGAAQPVYALTSRSEVVEDLWQKMPRVERKYCGLCGDFMNTFFRVHFKLGELRETANADGFCRFEH